MKIGSNKLNLLTMREPFHPTDQTLPHPVNKKLISPRENVRHRVLDGYDSNYYIRVLTSRDFFFAEMILSKNRFHGDLALVGERDGDFSEVVFPRAEGLPWATAW